MDAPEGVVGEEAEATEEEDVAVGAMTGLPRRGVLSKKRCHFLRSRLIANPVSASNSSVSSLALTSRSELGLRLFWTTLLLDLEKSYHWSEVFWQPK